MQENTATPSQSGWATMSQVSDALGIKLTTVRQIVHRALLDGQEWVKRAPYPAPNDPVRWLIDTSHAIYQYHERRWRKLAKKHSHSGCAPSNGHSVVRPAEAQEHPTEFTEAWPELCRWLAKHGLVVFVNALASDQRWQWFWMEHAGSGYPDATTAITAAIQHQLSQSYPFSSPYATEPSTEPDASPELPFWNGLFRRK